VRSLREEFDFPIFLNADHTHSLTKAVEAARAGFDAIVFDASALRVGHQNAACEEKSSVCLQDGSVRRLRSTNID
jgi:fructose/tagatose bisphosphate aldolase